MKNIYFILTLVFLIVACKQEAPKKEVPTYKIPVFAWESLKEEQSDEDLIAYFKDLKALFKQINL